MTIYKPQTPEEAVNLRKANAETSVYLAGGTDDLRLNGAAQGKDLIDINGLGFNTIEKKDGKIWIGALCTLQDLIDSDLIPEFIKDAARFCASFVKRNSATVGGNIGLRRQDSYLAAALAVANATLVSITPHGEEEKALKDYFNTACKRLIMYVVIDADVKGWVKRYGNTTSSHAALIAACSESQYALSVSGSNFICGETPDLYKEMKFIDDLTGSASYKEYLAQVVFSQKEVK